jgi:hypothetical protein
MSLSRIQRRLQKLEDATQVNEPRRAVEFLQHWGATGEFCFPDGSPLTIPVLDEIMRDYEERTEE